MERHCKMDWSPAVFGGVIRVGAKEWFLTFLVLAVSQPTNGYNWATHQNRVHNSKPMGLGRQWLFLLALTTRGQTTKNQWPLSPKTIVI